MQTDGGKNGAASKSALVSWCLYDWANSAFPTVILTFVFSAYFTKGVAADAISGTELWGFGISISALVVAVLSPLLGAAADRGGTRKPWVAAFTALCVAASALLWFIEPDPSFVLPALVLVGVANGAFEFAMVFYNAMLPDLAAKGRIGRLSGYGWGLGYLGGLLSLGLVLVAFVQTDTPAFGLSKEMAEHVRAAGPLVAIWMAVFSLPFFLFTPDRKKTGVGFVRALTDGWTTLIETLRRVRDYKDAARFLLARMIYTDGLNTLFAFGGIYAAGTFAMTFDELILFGIAMNVTAGLGAAAFAPIDDRIGPKRTIQIAVGCLVILGAALVLVEGKEMFWLFGLPLGLFVGPAQAASRSMMAHLAPKEMTTEMFGLYALSGKATAFVGPALLGVVTASFNSQRAGMATILIFFVAGLWLLRKVPDVRG